MRRNNNIKAYLNIVFDTPWKFVYEIGMYFVKPFILLYLKILGVDIQKGSKFYGFPKILISGGSKIAIGKRFEDRNWRYANPLGINHPTIICTWKRGAEIKIGNDVGISGGSIVASESIEIGDGTIIGANTTIIDTDFHPVNSQNRRYDKENIKSSPVKIGKNVFIGASCLILKGALIPDNTVIPAGVVVGADKSKGFRFY